MDSMIDTPESLKKTKPYKYYLPIRIDSALATGTSGFEGVQFQHETPIEDYELIYKIGKALSRQRYAGAEVTILNVIPLSREAREHWYCARTTPSLTFVKTQEKG